MPAYSLDLNDKPTLLRILAVLIEENEARELRFSAANYDSFDKKRLCVVDFDRKKSEIVLRLTSSDGRIALVEPEAHQWSLPLAEAPTERARVRAAENAMRRSVPSDEQLAEMEEKMARERDIANDVEAGKSPTRITIRK